MSLAHFRQRHLPLRTRTLNGQPYWLLRGDRDGHADSLGAHLFWAWIDEGPDITRIVGRSGPLRDVEAAEVWWREFAGS